MRVGLVLGAGGVLGASWLIGALEALEAETGWRALTDPLLGGDYRLQRALPPLGPGSWLLALNTLLHLRRHPPATVIAGWLPRGFISTAPIQGLVERFVPDAWPEHPGYWAVAADYASGKRVAFGRDDAPDARVAEAVAASCAIPGFYHPVKIAGRRYVDGGICSTSNLDLLCGAGLDLVICLNPMSSIAPMTGGSPADRFAALMRAAAGRRLGHEAKKLRADGADVLILHPSRDDCALMGLNLMSSARRVQVMEQARKSVARELRRLRGSHLLPSRSDRRMRPAA